jgi:plasmid stability protein
MPVNLSIKEVPDELAEALRDRARWNHRSLQGELMAMVEIHTRVRPFKAIALWQEVQKLGLRTDDDSTQIVREDRDSRSR